MSSCRSRSRRGSTSAPVVKKRDISDDERTLWEDVTRDVRPARRARVRSAPETKRVRVKAPVDLPPKMPAAPPQAKARASGPITGVDGATAERLRRGRIEPDARLDLHGMTQQTAYGRLLAFVRRGHDEGYRCLLVITGKGNEGRESDDGRTRGFVMPERSKAGVLRSLVPQWLEQPEVRPLVVGLQSAHQRHGGAGAFYVYLRRKRR
jgi:DNA-nicking Smr family endonuclease